MSITDLLNIAHECTYSLIHHTTLTFPHNIHLRLGKLNICYLVGVDYLDCTVASVTCLCFYSEP